MANNAGKIIAWGLGIATVIGGIALLTRQEGNVTPSGETKFNINVINLPAGATSWGCAFKIEDTFYQPTNHPTIGAYTFSPDGTAEFDVPAPSGLLSISAFSGVSLTEIVQLVNYQIK